MNNMNFDKLLSKYISIWIWSILFGAATALTYSAIGNRPFERWGILSIVLIVIFIYLIICLVMVWLYMYKYLIRYILPKFFPIRDTEVDDFVLNKHAIYIRRTFIFLFAATLLRVSIVLIESFLYMF